MFTGNGTRKARNRYPEEPPKERRTALRTTTLLLATSMAFSASWVPIDGFVGQERSNPVRTASKSGPPQAPL